MEISITMLHPSEKYFISRISRGLFHMLKSEISPTNDSLQSNSAVLKLPIVMLEVMFTGLFPLKRQKGFENPTPICNNNEYILPVFCVLFSHSQFVIDKN